MVRFGRFAVGIGLVGLAIACGGLPDLPGAAPPVAAEMEQLEGSTLESETPLTDLQFGGDGAAPELDEGNGVQILHVSPYGPEQRAIQVAVVFDRPMIAMTDIDTQNAAVPVSCTPEVGMRARWAGTSTAVLVPGDNGTFPKATRYTCSVAAGVKAVDGVALEKSVSWTFDSPRPRVVSSFPSEGTEDFDPAEKLLLGFDQPVEPAEVKRATKLEDARGQPVAFEVSRPASGEATRVEITAKLVKDTAYTLSVPPGLVATEGPLASEVPFQVTFRTYPPLELSNFFPDGKVSPSTSYGFDATTRVSRDEIGQHLTLTPKPDGWTPPSGDWEWTELRQSVWLAPNTKYTLRLSAGMKDVYGQTLAQPYEWSFETGDYDPWVNAPTGLQLYAANNPLELPFKHMNATRIDAVGAAVDPRALVHPDHWRTLAERLLGGPAGIPVPVDVDPTANEVELDGLGLGALLGPDGKGWVATRLQAPNVSCYDGRPCAYQGMFVVTDLGSTMKIGPNGTDVWVTTFATGAPVAGASVTLMVDRSEVATVPTDADGLAHFDAPGADWSRWSHKLWARIEQGDDVSLVTSDWTDGLSPWNFSVYEGAFRNTSTVAHGYADRGVYRLGDPVYARASFRIQSAKGLEQAVGTAKWTLDDPEGTTVAEGEGTLDRRGGLAVTTALPGEGALGTWYLSVRATGEGWADAVSIPVPARAYRPPAFRVEVAQPEFGVAGQGVNAIADARYLFGAPLSKGEITWRGWTEARDFQPDGWDGWSFVPESHWWEEDTGSEDAVGVLGTTTGPLADGRSLWMAVVPKGERTRPVALMMEAEVTDVDRQVIANRGTTLVHPAQHYVGLRATNRLPAAGSSVSVEVAAVSPNGDRVSAPVTVSVARRDWNSVRERGMNGQWRWVNTVVDEPVATETVTPGSAPATMSFVPQKSGYYVVTGTSEDALGNTATSEYGVYVVGKGYVGWGRRDDNQMELVPDKRKYLPGETARILVKSPAENLHALVTVEREGVLWKKRVKLDGTAATVEVPITAAFQPNVYVSVVAVQGAGPQDAPDKGRPNVFMGLVDLTVDSSRDHLAVDVIPGDEVYRPRDEVEVTVAVKRDGKALPNAGVTLYAVDHAVLSLTAYQTPDAFDTFYAHRGIGVVTADARTATLDRAPYLKKGTPRGGGGGMEESGPEVRSNFVTTVTWQPDLVTGPDGTVKAKFTLPDNLTTFRIMAVADAGATSFGSADEEIRVTRPLIVRPALPRLMRAEDRAYAGVVVHNGVDTARTVTVTAEGAGPVEITGSPATVSVPAGGSIEVPFGIRALEQGEVKFLFTATSGDDRDAVEWPLEIEREVPLDTIASGGKVDGSLTEQIARPDGAYTAWGGLTLDLSSSALVGAGSGIDYLRAYPHECVEQLTSRTLANLMALRVRDRAQVPVPEAVLRADVATGLARLSAYRASRGGMAYWAGDWRASVMGTAYAVELMGRAKEAGFTIDEKLLAHDVEYLRDAIAGRVVVEWWEDPLLSLHMRSYIASALARAGQGDAGLNGWVYERRSQLSVYGTATLLEAIVRTPGPDARTTELARTIAGRSYVEPTEASIKENDASRWSRMWGSDDLSTAAALEALVLAKSNEPLLPKYALFLASSKVGDRWANTRATAAVLAALAAYAEAYEPPAGSKTQAKVTLTGASLFDAALTVPSSERKVVPMPQVTDGPLVFSASGGPLYYEARLTYAPKVPPPRDQGFGVHRTVEVVDGGGPNGQVIGGTMLRITLSVVTPVERIDVAVVDPVPAGLEIVDSSFAITSRAPTDDEGEEENMYELGYTDSYEERSDELPEYGGSYSFDHHEIDDAEVRLYASVLPAGVHTYRYVVRATSPGTYVWPPASAEEMYEPENFGRTKGGTLTIGAAPSP
ncbi:MAG: Ig-like domain-containing protein [Myxococcota bacterium]